MAIDARIYEVVFAGSAKKRRRSIDPIAPSLRQLKEGVYPDLLNITHEQVQQWMSDYYLEARQRMVTVRAEATNIGWLYAQPYTAQPYVRPADLLPEN